VIMILAIVKRMENPADSLTGEHLELGAFYLCVGVEMREEKKCNDSLMIALHKQACKIHAK
jgi:hypothetical protein